MVFDTRILTQYSNTPNQDVTFPKKTRFFCITVLITWTRLRAALESGAILPALGALILVVNPAVTGGVTSCSLVTGCTGVAGVSLMSPKTRISSLVSISPLFADSLPFLT